MRSNASGLDSLEKLKTTGSSAFNASQASICFCSGASKPVKRKPPCDQLLQGIDSCPVSISHDGVMKVIWRCYESVMEPFLPLSEKF